jgi:hypothetical protein
MAKIVIPEPLRYKLGSEMKMDIHWIDVKLSNGRTLKNLVVRSGTYITGHANDPNGEGALPFSSADIKAIRRHSFFPFW